jgi:hypothetical protein
MPYREEKLENLSTPRSGLFEVKVNEWWLVNKWGELLFYRRTERSPLYSSPMCNPNKQISDIVVKKYPDHHVEQIPIVYVPHMCESSY